MAPSPFPPLSPLAYSPFPPRSHPALFLLSPRPLLLSLYGPTADLPVLFPYNSRAIPVLFPYNKAAKEQRKSRERAEKKPTTSIKKSNKWVNLNQRLNCPTY